MTRESRILVTLVLMAGAGVSGLMFVANQYKKALTQVSAGQGTRNVTDDATARAMARVEGYLAARGAVKQVIARYPAKIERLTAVVTAHRTDAQGQEMGDAADASSAYRDERSNAFSARGLTFDDYALVRTAWRSYRSGGIVGDDALVAVFAARRTALIDADLGPVEALDDAIK